MARPSRRSVNLVFQGGGVRGIAYAGVLAGIPAELEIHSVGGTSAGAIVAALLAIGVRGNDLRSILADPELFKLLEEEEVSRMSRLTAAWADARDLLVEATTDGVSCKRVWQFSRKHRQALRDLGAVWNARGLHSSGRIRKWLDRVLQGKRFEQIGVHDLKIVAADVNEARYQVYSKKKHLDRPLAEAVHASISIPIFFAPFRSESLHLVDGGLLSNFPSFLFAQADFPTIGFRLHDISRPAAGISSTMDYLKGLLLTMTEAHDKERGDPPYFKAYMIPTHIPSTKFALDPTDVEALYTLGRAVGENVEWDKYSSPSPVIPFYDPKPQDALRFSLSQANELWQKYASDDLWVDKLRHDAEFTLRIERDWTTRYDRIGTLSVEGTRPLFLMRFSATGFSDPSVGRQSLVDIDHVCEELLDDGGRRDLIRIPAFNKEPEKGFVVFYVPPVAPGQKPRKIHTGFGIYQEFAATVGKGYGDTAGYVARQIAREHSFKLKFRILVDTELPRLQCTSSFGRLVVEKSEPGVEASTGRPYRVYECDVPETLLNGEVHYNIELRKAA